MKRKYALIAAAGAIAALAAGIGLVAVLWSTTATTAPTAPTAPTSAPCAPAAGLYRSTVDGFCLADPDPSKVIAYTYATSTTDGKINAHAYDTGAALVLVYKPHESDPQKALAASLDWNYAGYQPIIFKGNPAKRLVTTGENQPARDPLRDVVLKVWHNGKIFFVLIISPTGEVAAMKILGTLDFM